MSKNELIKKIVNKHPAAKGLTSREVEAIVTALFDEISAALGREIE